MEDIRRKTKQLKEKVEYKVRQFQMKMDSPQRQLGENRVSEMGELSEVRELQAELKAIEQEFREFQEFQEQIVRRRT
jgi:hypothetical protein